MVYVYLKVDLCVVLTKYSFTISGGVNTDVFTSFIKKHRVIFFPGQQPIEILSMNKDKKFWENYFLYLKLPPPPPPMFFLE